MGLVVKGLCLLHPENERDDVVCEVLSVTKGFEFLDLLSDNVPQYELRHADTHVSFDDRSTAG